MHWGSRRERHVPLHDYPSERGREHRDGSDGRHQHRVLAALRSGGAVDSFGCGGGSGSSLIAHRLAADGRRFLA
jgi:hypothetical protein